MGDDLPYISAFTQKPTTEPSTDPTTTPSNTPSDPTSEPTNDPTKMPSTSFTPTAGPSYSLEQTADSSSIPPSDTPSETVPTELTTTSPNTTESSDPSSNQKASDSSMQSLIMIMVIVGVIVVSILAILYLMFRRLEFIKMSNDSAYVQLENVDVDTDDIYDDRMEGEGVNGNETAAQNGHEINDLLQSAAGFGAYWRDEVCSDEMMAEWINYYAPNLKKLRDGMRGKENEYRCYDANCRWNGGHGKRLLFPHQIVHCIVYHAEGMTLGVFLYDSSSRALNLIFFHFYAQSTSNASVQRSNQYPVSPPSSIQCRKRLNPLHVDAVMTAACSPS